MESVPIVMAVAASPPVFKKLRSLGGISLNSGEYYTKFIVF